MEKYKHDSIAVDADGEMVVWTNGLLSGRKDLKRNVVIAGSLNAPVSLIHGANPVNASLSDNSDLLAVTAALMSAAPGRTRLLEAPEEVMDWYSSYEPEEGFTY